MNAHTKSLWIIVLSAASMVVAADSAPLNRREQTTDHRPINEPTQVWASAAKEAELAIPGKLLRHAQRLVKKLDRNGSGAVEVKEWQPTFGDPRKVDRNHDGVISAEELAGYLAEYARSHPLKKEESDWQRLPQPPAVIFHPVTPTKPATEQSAPAQGDGPPSAEKAPSGTKKAIDESREADAARNVRKFYLAPSTLPRGLPDWFNERDADGDGQLTLGEFAPDGSLEQRKLFARQDQNGDGLLTPDEVVGAVKTSSEKETPAEAKNASEKKAP